MKLRRIAALVLAGMTVTNLAACSSGSAKSGKAVTEAAAETAKTESAAETTASENSAAGVFAGVEKEETNLSGELIYWSAFTGGSGEWDQSRVDLFNKMYADKGIHVTRQQIEGAGIKNGALMSAVASGTNAPDLIISDAPIDVYSFAVEGAFMAVDDLLPKVGIDPDSFFGGLDDLIKVDGKTYLIPQDANVHLLYYNKKLVREAGLDPEAPPTTIEELNNWAEALSIPDGNGGFKQLGLIPWIGDGGDTSGDAFHIPFVFGTNVYDPAANKLNLTEDKMINYFEWIKGYSEKYSPTIQEWGTSAGGVFDPSCPFYTEKVAMYFCGNWMANAIKLTVGDAIEWGVTAVPAPDYGRAKATTLGANPFAIVEGSSNAELAAFFIKFCISPAIQEDNFAQWRSIPCSDSAFDGVSLTKNGDAMYALEREIANNPENGVPAMCSVSTELADQFQKARQEIIFNGADITSTLQALQDRMQSALDSAN